MAKVKVCGLDGFKEGGNCTAAPPRWGSCWQAVSSIWHCVVRRKENLKGTYSRRAQPITPDISEITHKKGLMWVGETPGEGTQKQWTSNNRRKRKRCWISQASRACTYRRKQPPGGSEMHCNLHVPTGGEQNYWFFVLLGIRTEIVCLLDITFHNQFCRTESVLAISHTGSPFGVDTISELIF